MRGSNRAIRTIPQTGLSTWFVSSGLLVASCVSTDLTEPAALNLCFGATDIATARAAVVSIRAEFELGIVPCSGVAIASNLVITALGCLMRPPEVGDPDQSASESWSRNRPYKAGSVRFATSCVRDGSWSVNEDGSFSAELGKPIPPEFVSVFGDDDETVVLATEIITPRAVSRCADGIAILRLEHDLPVPPASIRLEDAFTLDESIQMSGHCSTGPRVDPRAVETQILGLTFETGNELAPPRGLWAVPAMSYFALGGAVSSASTGALIGVIASGLEPQCESSGSEQHTVAIRLAPFRRMLLDVASNRGIVLRAESATWGHQTLPACPAK